MDLHTALAAAAAISAVALAWEAADLWKPSATFAAFFEWRIVGGARAMRPQGEPLRWQRFLDTHCLVRNGLAISVLGASAFTLAAWNGWAVLSALSAALVLAMLCFLQFRLVVGLDGSDQIQVILWATLLAATIRPDSPLTLIALGFLTIQVWASYWVAGVAKLTSSSWRSGSAVRDILATRQYGVPVVRRLLRRNGASLAVAWSVIVFEVVGPFALLLGFAGAVGFFSVALVFHLTNWGVMGLRSFALSFPATYPLVLAFAHKG